MKITSEYNLRSLQHEQRMLELYRKGSASDGELLEPLANSCRRAAAFEWCLHEDAGSIRRLWEEAARALAQGFLRKRSGFARRSEELHLALNLSIASRNFDLVSALMHTTVARSSVKTGRFARSPLLLLNGYLFLARAILERRKDHITTAQRLLENARPDSDYEWWAKQFPSTHEAAWKIDEHEATRGLLSVIARFMVDREPLSDKDSDLDSPAAADFAELMDRAMLSLDQFIDSEINHRPKLYLWLPGIAVSILAESAGLPLNWLAVRQRDNQKGYARLPLGLVCQ